MLYSLQSCKSVNDKPRFLMSRKYTVSVGNLQKSYLVAEFAKIFLDQEQVLLEGLF
jgi:hypothetical protein